MSFKIPENSMPNVNDTYVIEGEGRLKGKKVMYVHIPSGPDPDYRDTYKAILNRAFQEGARSIALPSLGSAHEDSIHPRTVVAVDEAIKFTNEHPEFHIDFAPNSTSVSDDFYEEIASRCLEGKTDLEHVTLTPGSIVEANDEILVCPMNNDAVENVQEAIDKALTDKQPPTKLTTNIDLENSTRTFGKVKIQLGRITDSNAEYLAVARPSYAYESVLEKATRRLMHLETKVVWKGTFSKNAEDVDLTTSGEMRDTNGTKGIIHGNPLYKGLMTEDDAYALFYRSALEKAHEKQAKSIAFAEQLHDGQSCPSSRIGWATMKAVHQFLKDHPQSTMEIHMVLDKESTYDAYAMITEAVLHLPNPLFESANHATSVGHPELYNKDGHLLSHPDVVTVDGEKPLKCEKVMFFRVPSTENMYTGADFLHNTVDDLERYYTLIFQEALKIQKQKGGTLSVALPPFAMRGLTKEVSMEAAIKAAATFKRENPSRNLLNIRIVPREEDEFNDNLFYETFRHLDIGVDIAPGHLELQEVDLLVMPVCHVNTRFEVPWYVRPLNPSVLNAVANNSLPEDPGYRTCRQKTRRRVDTEHSIN